jgi:hypothetical protein
LGILKNVLVHKKTHKKVVIFWGLFCFFGNGGGRSLTSDTVTSGSALVVGPPSAAAAAAAAAADGRSTNGISSSGRLSLPSVMRRASIASCLRLEKKTNYFCDKR